MCSAASWTGADGSQTLPPVSGPSVLSGLPLAPLVVYSSSSAIGPNPYWHCIPELVGIPTSGSNTSNAFSASSACNSTSASNATNAMRAPKGADVHNMTAFNINAFQLPAQPAHPVLPAAQSGHMEQHGAHDGQPLLAIPFLQSGQPGKFLALLAPSLQAQQASGQVPIDLPRIPSSFFLPFLCLLPQRTCCKKFTKTQAEILYCFSQKCLYPLKARMSLAQMGGMM